MKSHRDNRVRISLPLLTRFFLDSSIALHTFQDFDSLLHFHRRNTQLSPHILDIIWILEVHLSDKITWKSLPDHVRHGRHERGWVPLNLSKAIKIWVHTQQRNVMTAVAVCSFLVKSNFLLRFVKDWSPLDGSEYSQNVPPAISLDDIFDIFFTMRNISNEMWNISWWDGTWSCSCSDSYWSN